MKMIPLVTLFLLFNREPVITDHPHYRIGISSKADPIAGFWQWFSKNQQRLRQFESDPNKYLAEFLKQAKKIKAGLAIELEAPQDGVINLTVSADGNVELFELVQQIVAKAPVIKGWKIIAFRQRMAFAAVSDMLIKAGDLQLDPKKIKFLPVVENGLLNLIIYVPGVNDENYSQVAYAGLLLLDNVLGEYDCATKVHSYDFHDLPAKTDARPAPRPLSELPGFVDEFHRKK